MSEKTENKTAYSCFRRRKKVLRECHKEMTLEPIMAYSELPYSGGIQLLLDFVTNDVKQWVWLMSLEYLNNVFTIYSKFITAPD